MRLRQIEVFRATMLTGTASEAARLLNVSQPVVTRVLQHAEASLGFRLFDRVRGRLQPTPEGLALYGDVERLYGELERVRRVSESLRHKGAGRLRVAATPSLADPLLVGAVRRFCARHPETQVQVLTHHTDEIVRKLLSNQLDIGFAFSPPRHEAIASEPVAAGHMLLARPRAFRLPGQPAPPASSGPPRSGKPRAARGRASRSTAAPETTAATQAPPATIPMRELLVHPFISYDDNSSLGLLVRQTLARHGLEPHSTLEVQTYSLALSLVQGGLGLALLDQYTALGAGDGAHDEAIALHAIEPPVPFEIHVLRASHRSLTHLADDMRAQFALAAQAVAASLPRRLEPSPVAVGQIP